MDPGQHEFVNFDAGQTMSDLQEFIERLINVNPKARMILTVSPVPLVATYEDRHILVSNTYSKAVLRAAADAVTRRNRMCDYFPSYEIVTGNHTRGEYFESDLRTVKQAGVDHVMRLFMQHYLPGEDDRKDRTQLDQQVGAEAKMLSEIICEEEALDSRV